MRQFQKRRSSSLTDKMEAGFIIGLTLTPVILAATAFTLYVYGVISAFKASVLLGLLFLFPPLGLVEGTGMLFRYDVALALKGLAAANGLML